MLRNFNVSLISVLGFAWCFCVLPSPCCAGDGEPELVVKVYRVVDLVSSAQNFPYEGTYLPGIGGGRPGSGVTTGSSATTGGMSGGMGGMGGGMGGSGMGGGMFQVGDAATAPKGGGAPVPAGPATGSMGGMGGGMGRGMMTHAAMPAMQRSGLEIQIGQLIEAITNVVDPETWDDVGGQGVITPLGPALAIRQTYAVHAKVQEFLKALQQESGAVRTLNIDAQWILVDRAELAKLVKGNQPDAEPGPGSPLDAAALRALPAESCPYTGRISALNGQMVYVISGDVQTFVQGAIPVVGGGTEVGYQPVIVRPHFGVLLQTSASVLPGDTAALLTVQSSITHLDSSATRSASGAKTKASGQVDLINASTQQLATSLRLPLDTPTLVGGMTFSESVAAHKQLYLVATVRGRQTP